MDTDEVGHLKAAIDREDLTEVQALLQRNPSLHSAPLGYGKHGPLTWVAECRVPRRPPTAARLAIAEWMIENGSDVHQGGNAPMWRAALDGERVPMMELLVRYGADIHVLESPCESVDPVAIEWLLRHGADPNRAATSALDHLIGSYFRAPEELAASIDLLLLHGARTRYDNAAVLAILRRQTDMLQRELAADPELVHRHFDTLDFGTTGTRMLTLRGATLLHVAAEFGNVEAADLLHKSGVDINARAAVDANGVGGQTPIFHSATQGFDCGLQMTRWLLSAGADLTVRCRVPGHYEKPGEILEVTALEYARRFPGEDNATLQLLADEVARFGTSG